ncbi:MAG: DUF72 domain-containing protein [Candidatus Eisenbacteria bacterium]|nr:DUF72 domain-containing protein [Candidatus Eisenbacteria bacterium]
MRSVISSGRRPSPAPASSRGTRRCGTRSTVSRSRASCGWAWGRTGLRRSWPAGTTRRPTSTPFRSRRASRRARPTCSGSRTSTTGGRRAADGTLRGHEEATMRTNDMQGDLFGGPEKVNGLPDGNGAWDSSASPPGVRWFGREGRIRIGTSGYSFADWVGTFYPAGTRRNGMLEEYVRHFDTVEINTSYYRVPDASMFERMERRTPPGFEFVVKLYKGMTHEIEDEPEHFRSFLEAVAPFREAGKFGGFLAQFPWRFKKNDDALAHLERLRNGFPSDELFVEFRHDSWMEDATFAFLREHDIGYCSVDEPSLKGLVPPLAEATTGTAYVRLHGRNAKNWWGRGGGDRYDYDYSTEELSEWSRKLLDLETKAKKVYAFFNNCHAGHAATNAELMMNLLEGELGS